jgi:integrase
MSVKLRGNKYHYRFTLNGEDHSGVCENCDTEAKAKAFEKEFKAGLGNIKSQKTLRALFDNHRYELAGGAPVSLVDGYELMLKKPVKRQPSNDAITQKRNYWKDFVAFLNSKQSELINLADVKKSHCEEYIKHLQDNGRFIKTVVTTVNVGTKNRKKLREREYIRDYKLSAKTIISIRNACAEVFTKLSEDAGVMYNPWQGVVLPTQDSESRDIFSEEELALITEGIKHDAFCKPLFIIAAATGLTEGDICTLKWNEILFSEGQ